MMKQPIRSPAPRHRRPLPIALVTLAIVLLGWAGIGLDPASLDLEGWRWFVEAQSRQPRLVRVFSHDGGISDIAWSPDGRMIAAGGLLHRALMIWDPHTGTLLHKLDREDGSISAVAWSPDSRYVAAGRWFTRATRSHVAINVWEAQSGRRVHALRGPLPVDGGTNDVTPRALKFSPDGRLLGAGHRGAISVHDVESGQLVRLIQGHPLFGGVFAFAGGGTHIVTAGEYQRSSLQAFEIATGEKSQEYTGDTDIPSALAHHPTDPGMASNHREKPIVIVWDASTGQPSRILEGHTKPVRALAYSHDGSRLVSAAWGGGVIVWNARTGERLATLPRPAEQAETVAISPDGRQVAAPVDRLIRIWDVSQALPGK